ncbi:MAG: TonB-dependent receptor [Paludibacter sp.]|nr:TonB-dependent receptor [Paludibacter sp.]
MRKRITILVQLSLFLVTSVFGGNISGKLIDSITKMKVEFATVSIFNISDNKFVKGGATNEAGEFSFKELEQGKYMLKVSYIGYSPIELPLSIDSRNANINLGVVELTGTSQKLNQVEVTGQKSQVSFEIDRKVFNVDQNLSSAGTSAAELLRNIPSVEVSVDGNILLRNNKNVIIWINGRPSGLNEDNRAQILEQMPAETIERIEIISNPSSKYSPDGSAGIINIVLKKVTRKGKSGSISVGGDTNKSRNSTFNFFYSNPKWEVNANLGYRNDVKKMFFNSDRWSWNTLLPDTIVRYSRDKVNMDGDGYFARGSATYHITSNDIISLSGIATTANRKVTEKIGNQKIKDGIETLDFRNSFSLTDRNTYNLSLDYTHSFNKKGHDIRTYIEQTWMNATSFLEINQLDSLQNNQYFQWTNSGANRRETNIQLDYTYPVNKISKLEFGYKGEFLWRDNTVNAEYGLSKNVRTAQHELDNLFGGSDNRNSVYANYSGKYKKLTYQVGLRSEYNILKNKSISYDKTGKDSTTNFNNNYPGLYPSVFLDYELPSNNKFQLNYTRRINLPKGRMTNPFTNVADSANIEFGNPNLKPEYSNSFELNHIKTWDDHMLSSLLYYRSTNNVIQWVNSVETVGKYDVKYIAPENITNAQAAGFEFILKNRLFKIMDLTSTLNLFYNYLDAFEYAGNQYAATENLGWSGRIIANITLPAGFMWQVSGGYASRRNIAQGETLPIWGLDSGLRKSFFNKKLMVNLTARDILNTRINKDITSGNNFYDYSVSQYSAHMVGLLLTYNFGNEAKKQEKTKNNESNPLGGED